MISNEEKETLYTKFHDKLVNYFSYHLNDENKAEDFASDVFIKIFDKYDSFDSSKSNLSTWIYAIARNFLFDYFRQNNTELEYNDDIYSGDENDEDVCNSDNLERLADALETLNPKEKQIIVEHYYNEVPLSTICKEMGISYIYAKVLHAKALKKLKEKLEK